MMHLKPFWEGDAYQRSQRRPGQIDPGPQKPPFQSFQFGAVPSAERLFEVGSPMYMAPEWWDGRGGTAYSDMWSVGVVLYELLALSRAWHRIS